MRIAEKYFVFKCKSAYDFVTYFYFIYSNHGRCYGPGSLLIITHDEVVLVDTAGEIVSPFLPRSDFLNDAEDCEDDIRDAEDALIDSNWYDFRHVPVLDVGVLNPNLVY